MELQDPAARSSRAPQSSEQEIQDLKEQLRLGDIDRRQFLRLVVRIGVSVPIAYALASEITGDAVPTEALAAVTSLRNAVERESAQIDPIVGSAAYLAMLQKLYREPEATRLELAKKTATVGALEKAGVPIKPGMRITTRFFEDPSVHYPSGRSEILSNCAFVGSKAPAIVAGGPSVCTTVCGGAGVTVGSSVGS